MSKAELIQQIAAIDDESLIADGAAAIVGDLDPRLFNDNAVDHFGYSDIDDRSQQAKILVQVREGLANRRTEFEQAGYRWHDHSLVKIDQVLEAIDAVPVGNRIGPLLALLRGECRIAQAGDQVLPAVADKFDAAMAAAGVVNDAVQTRSFGALEQQIDAFEQARADLQAELEQVGHPAVKRHLETWVLGPVTAFATGPACTDARDIVANKTDSNFRTHWKAAKKRAETAFVAANSGNSGKKDKLSNHIEFEDDLGPALDKMEKAKRKGKDYATHQADAIRIGTEYLKKLNRLPEDFRRQTPDFFHPLQKTLAGIVASVQSYG